MAWDEKHSAKHVHSRILSVLKCSDPFTFSTQGGILPFISIQKQDASRWDGQYSRARLNLSWRESYLPCWEGLCREGSFFCSHRQAFLAFLQDLNRITNWIEYLCLSHNAISALWRRFFRVVQNRNELLVFHAKLRATANEQRTQQKKNLYFRWRW